MISYIHPWASLISKYIYLTKRGNCHQLSDTHVFSLCHTHTYTICCSHVHNLQMNRNKLFQCSSEKMYWKSHMNHIFNMIFKVNSKRLSYISVKQMKNVWLIRITLLYTLSVECEEVFTLWDQNLISISILSIWQ